MELHAQKVLINVQHKSPVRLGKWFAQTTRVLLTK